MHKLLFAILFIAKFSFTAAIEIHDFVVKGTSANGEAPNYYAFPESVKPLTGGIFRSPIDNTLIISSDLCLNKSEVMSRTIELCSRRDYPDFTFLDEKLYYRKVERNDRTDHNFAKLLKSIYFSREFKAILKDNIDKFELSYQLPSAVTLHLSTTVESYKEAFEGYNAIGPKLTALSQKKYGPHAKMFFKQTDYKNFKCILIIASPAEDYVAIDITVIWLDNAIWSQIKGRD
ncbi:MAG TPA: hypothetical protein VEL47_00215 [Myxococcota bacterium]|nr:hypothetical protein [Myxococcota bacterium]